jgi:hypothetical protein
VTGCREWYNSQFGKALFVALALSLRNKSFSQYMLLFVLNALDARDDDRELLDDSPVLLTQH